MSDLKTLLDQTSRTFALAIPLLPEPTRNQVNIAYLLFRIADTFEDAEIWPAQKRIQALSDFSRVLASPEGSDVGALARRWTEDPPVRHEGYLELLAETGQVVAALAALPKPARDIVSAHARCTAEGMVAVVRRGGDGRLQLQTLEELRGYCYTVAGIVGEMLTELFLLDRPPLLPLAGYLQARSVAFGEGLQLVNILKDSEADAKDGRSYLPSLVGRGEVVDVALEDLRAAAEYSSALQRGRAERGLVAFTALPVLLARAALRRISEAGPGAKISRAQVAAIYAGLQARLHLGLPALDEGAEAAPQPVV